MTFHTRRFLRDFGSEFPQFSRHRPWSNALELADQCSRALWLHPVWTEAALDSAIGSRPRRIGPVREAKLEPGDVEVIGNDGQTIYQEPPIHHLLRNYDDSDDLVSRWLYGPYACGLQIGEPSIVAEATETHVVTQFRPMDHALGGTGAPLMQYLDYVAFRDIGPILTLNIGGIANCHLAHADRS